MARKWLIYGFLADFCLFASYCKLFLLAKIKLWPVCAYYGLLSMAKCWSYIVYEALYGCYTPLLFISGSGGA
jgi:hypothetical protein